MNPDNPTLRFLYSLQKSGIKAGLGNIRVLLNALGHPEKAFPSVHIAGTNGKGSTAAMIAAVLASAGYRTGLYTSPHLMDFSERIRIDGRKISMDRVGGYTRMIVPEIRRTRATFFDATTAIAFGHFADRKVDIAVIETGLGGRWDSTNVVRPLVSVITSVGLEHREYLGNTIRKIAFEKAGIIKRGVPCVVGGLPPEAMEVVRRRAGRMGSRLLRARRTSPPTPVASSPEGITVDVRFGRKTLPKVHVAAAGSHQAGNAAIALRALGLLAGPPNRFAIDGKAVRDGLSSLRAKAGFSGRLQFLRRTPPVIADVAHNPDGIRALVAGLRDLHAGKYRIVFGVMSDKEYRVMLDLLAPLSRMFIFVRPDVARARDPVDLLNYTASQNRVPAILGGTVRDGVKAAMAENRVREPVLITGSHFVVGEALGVLGIPV